MSETRIKIKELEMNGETAIRIAECLKKHETEIWKVLSGEINQALRIHDIVEQSEQLKCGNQNPPCAPNMKFGMLECCQCDWSE